MGRRRTNYNSWFFHEVYEPHHPSWIYLPMAKTEWEQQVINRAITPEGIWPADPSDECVELALECYVMQLITHGVTPWAINRAVASWLQRSVHSLSTMIEDNAVQVGHTPCTTEVIGSGESPLLEQSS